MSTDQSLGRSLGQGFASRSVAVHLARGVVGLALLLGSFVLVPLTGALSLLLVLPALVALGGCPSCWLVGLLLQTRGHRTPGDETGRGGECLTCRTP